MWFLLVPLALYSVFFLLPSILGIGYSFTDWNSRSMGEVNFVGLENYIERLPVRDRAYPHVYSHFQYREADTGPVSGDHAE